MATTPTNVPTTGLVSWLSGDLRRAAYLQLALAVLFGVVSAIYWVDYRKSGTPPTGEKTEKKVDDLKELLKKDRKENDPDKAVELPKDPDKRFVALWTMLIAMLFLLGALWAVAANSQPNRSVAVRRMIAVIGGSVGLISVLLGVIVLYRSQDGLLKWLDNGEAEEGKQTIIGLMILLASLGLIFLSVLPARAEERNDSVLRRVVYGANNVVVGILLLIVLGVANVWVGMKVPEKLDATSSKFYSLDEKSTEFLKSVDQTVNLYLIASTTQEANIYRDLEALLKNSQDTNPNIKTHFLLPGQDNSAIVALHERFKLPATEQGQGILVTVGEDESKKSFIPLRTLTSLSGEDPKSFAYTFDGENKLLNELNYLTATGGDPVLYFTQGNGEIDLFDTTGAKSRTAMRLKQMLTEKKFTLKPLPFQIGKPFEVPKDATAVVVLAPRRPMPMEVAKPLHDYVFPEENSKTPHGMPDKPPTKSGRLIIVLPPIKEADSDKVAVAALDTLLNDAGIAPMPFRVMTALPPEFRRRLPLDVTNASATNRALGGGHPLAKLLRADAPFLLENARPFQVVPPRNKSLRAIPIIVTDPEEPTWLEPNFNVDGPAIAKALWDRSNVKATSELQREKNLDQRSEPLAFVVVEMVAPTDPSMMQRPSPSDLKPRMVVFGSDSIVSDEFLSKVGPNVVESHLGLFGGSVEWLRERPASIGIKARSHDVFILTPEKIDDWRLFFAPAVWTVAGILGLGVVVWVLRRS